MFRPSAAPRWKMATRIFLRVPASAAYRARCSQTGTAPTPTMAKPAFLKNILRVDMGDSPPLKVGRAEDEAGDDQRLGYRPRRKQCHTRHSLAPGAATPGLHVVTWRRRIGLRFQSRVDCSARLIGKIQHQNSGDLAGVLGKSPEF